jgi:hypothetical protein
MSASLVKFFENPPAKTCLLDIQTATRMHNTPKSTLGNYITSMLIPIHIVNLIQTYYKHISKIRDNTDRIALRKYTQQRCMDQITAYKKTRTREIVLISEYEMIHDVIGECKRMYRPSVTYLSLAQWFSIVEDASFDLVFKILQVQIFCNDGRCGARCYRKLENEILETFPDKYQFLMDQKDSLQDGVISPVFIKHNLLMLTRDLQDEYKDRTPIDDGASDRVFTHLFDGLLRDLETLSIDRIFHTLTIRHLGLDPMIYDSD